MIIVNYQRGEYCDVELNGDKTLLMAELAMAFDFVVTNTDISSTELAVWLATSYEKAKKLFAESEGVEK